MTDEKTEKAPSLLKRLSAEHQERKVSKKETAELIGALEVARSKTALAQASLAKAQAAESEASLALVRAFGRRGIRLSTGETLIPSCRGEVVYYRTIGTGDIVAA